MSTDYAERAARETAAKEQRVAEAFEVISRAINGGYGDGVNILATLVANEHPTLSGQFAKAVAIGIMRRAVYNPEWRPGQRWDRDCQLNPMSADNPPHPDHDGRHSCTLIIGAMLASTQWYV